MKQLLVIVCALALGACAAQQSALQSASPTPEGQQAESSENSAASRRERKRKSDQNYVTSLERRDRTGSRINRVRRKGEPDDDRTAGKRIATVSREELEDIDARSAAGEPISGEE